MAVQNVMMCTDASVQYNQNSCTEICTTRENPNTLDMVDQNIPFFDCFIFIVEITHHLICQKCQHKGVRSTSNRKNFTRQCDVTELNTTPKVDVENVTNFLLKIPMPCGFVMLCRKKKETDSYKFSLHGFKKLSLLLHLASSVLNARKLGLLQKGINYPLCRLYK